jgi:hypothetical protein
MTCFELLLCFLETSDDHRNELSVPANKSGFPGPQEAKPVQMC